VTRRRNKGARRRRGRKDSKDEKGKENYKMSASVVNVRAPFLVVLFRFADIGFFFVAAVEYINEAQPAHSVRSRVEFVFSYLLVVTIHAC